MYFLFVSVPSSVYLTNAGTQTRSLIRLKKHRYWCATGMANPVLQA